MTNSKKIYIPLADPARELQHITNFNKNFKKELLSGNYIGGRFPLELEKNLSKFMKKKYIVTLNSGTDALSCALYALGVGKGDEVILPSFTFVATAEAVINIGATPVFADVEISNQCISLEKIKPLITKKTKCIIPVHLYGNDADIQNISNFCKENDIYLVEDCAQSFGSKTKSNFLLGSFGDISAFSCYPSKTLGGIGDGGFIATDNENYFKKINIYKNHGQVKTYEHKISGINSRMDSLNAFTLLNKLKIFEESKKTRNEFVDFYDSIFNNYTKVKTNLKHSGTLFNYYTIQLPTAKRSLFQKIMNKNNIVTSIFYRKPLHKQYALKNYGYKHFDLNNTEYLSKRVVSLPLFAYLKKFEKDHLEKTIINTLDEIKII